MRTKEERLASYRAAFLEKVKKWNWNDEEECSYKRRGRKPSKQFRSKTPKFRSPGERIAWEKQQLEKSKQPPKKYNWF